MSTLLTNKLGTIPATEIEMYRTPGNKSGIVTSLVLANTTSNGVTASIRVGDSAQAGNKFYLIKDVFIPKSQSFTIKADAQIILKADDVIYLSASAANSVDYVAALAEKDL